MRAILTYHSIDSSESPVSVDEGAFRRHMEWLASQPIDVVPLEEIGAPSGTNDAVALTFDDGFENFSDTAHPILRDQGFPATVFVVSGHVGGDNRWGGAAHPGIPTLPLLDWDQLGLLAEQGVTLGAHTVRHAHLTRLTADEVEAEFVGCKEAIRARTGREATALAYPFGDHDECVVALAERYFDQACTTRLRALSPVEASCRLPRLDMFYFRSPGRLEAWGTAAFTRYVWLRRTLRELRALLSSGA